MNGPHLSWNTVIKQRPDLLNKKTAAFGKVSVSTPLCKDLERAAESPLHIVFAAFQASNLLNPKYLSYILHSLLY